MRTGRVVLATWTAVHMMLFPDASLAQPRWLTKPVADQWVWFEDYAFAWATYTVACSPGCTCQAGMGPKMFGEPRGEKIRFAGAKDVLTIGMGAIHIRRVAGDRECAAAVTPGNFETIRLVDIPW